MQSFRRIPSHAARPKTGPGFAARGLTLIDVTVAVLIVGILSAVIVPRFTEYSVEQRLRSTVQKFSADYHYARRYAMATSSNVFIQATPDADTYHFSGVPHPAWPNRDYVVNVTDPPWNCVLRSINFDGTIGLKINAAGSLTQGGKFVFSNGSQTAACSIGVDGNLNVEYAL